MKTMWKKAIGIICAGGLSVLYLTGCSGDVVDNSKIPVEEINQNSNAVDEPLTNKENDEHLENGENSDGVDDNAADNILGTGSFFDGANLQGSVVEFSDEGFSLSPATTETEAGGGQIMAQAAPGSESDESNVQITYTDNTFFQIVNLSKNSQSEISREDTDKESVKKQSSVCVFGSCQDTYHWTADKILILRWQ